MRSYDVFNGDADGICALHQLRLAEPLDAILVTGLKRDIELLRKVPAAAGDVVTVLDISLDRNRESLVSLLQAGVTVRYFDHHYAGEVPVHAGLEAVLDDSPDVCTSIIIDRRLGGRFRTWAVAGAFGDNAGFAAMALARSLRLNAAGFAALYELGTALNYAAYGRGESETLVLPEDLYRIVSRYSDPFELVAREPLIGKLAAERHADLKRAFGLRPMRTNARSDAWLLPDAPWARRVTGAFANRLTAIDPDRAHAVLTPIGGGDYVVSVRAPRRAKRSAVDLCRRFKTGGGRAPAAGIDRLASESVDDFLDAFAAWNRGATTREPRQR